jgi:hypothetical protein
LFVLFVYIWLKCSVIVIILNTCLNSVSINLPVNCMHGIIDPPF